MDRYFELRDESPVVLLDQAERDKYDEVRDSGAISSYAKDARKQLEDFNDYKLKVYLPTDSPKMVLGAIYHMGNPRDPVIAIFPVTKRGKTLQACRNHANCID